MQSFILFGISINSHIPTRNLIFPASNTLTLKTFFNELSLIQSSIFLEPMWLFGHDTNSLVGFRNGQKKGTRGAQACAPVQQEAQVRAVNGVHAELQGH